MKYYFMSFRNAKKNENLGVCIVAASNPNTAVRKTIDLKINPGGEIRIEKMDKKQFKEQGLELDKLYTRSEMIKLGYEIGE